MPAARHAGLPGFFCLFLFRLRLLREFRKRAAEFLGGKGPHPGAVVPIGRKQTLGLQEKAPRRRRAARPSPRRATESPARAPPALRWSTPWNRPCPWSWPAPRRECASRTWRRSSATPGPKHFVSRKIRMLITGLNFLSIASVYHTGRAASSAAELTNRAECAIVSGKEITRSRVLLCYFPKRWKFAPA